MMGKKTLWDCCCHLCCQKAAFYHYEIVYKRQSAAELCADGMVAGDDNLGVKLNEYSDEEDGQLPETRPVSVSSVGYSPAIGIGSLTRDLRHYLNTRFLKGSADHDLQNTIRDSLYLRTVPCTTRPKRAGEEDGVDYTFLTLEEFLALERSGNLLESGIYEGNHYGTPKPPRESPIHCPPVRGLANGNLLQPHPHTILPGAHPSSEGKRRRNRSNVEAMASKSMDPDDSQPLRSRTPSSSSVATNLNNTTNSLAVKDVNLKLDPGTPPELGPLPSNWEKAFTENGEPYFIDHATGTSQWLDPRLARVQKKTIEDCADDELPYGWEKIDDPQFGTYYIDHINRQTQYENPVIQAKRTKQLKPQHPPPPPLLSPNGKGSGYFIDSMATLKRDLPNVQRPEKPHTNFSGPSDASLKPQSGLNVYFPCLPCLGDAREECGDSAPSPPLRPSEPPPSAHHFTKNPAELRGTSITTVLMKSARGFGFTIVGGDDEVEEFLQIKSVVPEGPAWHDGKLKQGDVLVYVNNTCVLGFTHRDVVSMFQKISVGDKATLEVCRGYPLPFDPNDPNTEIVTTVAVSADDDDNSLIASDPKRPTPPLPSLNFSGGGSCCEGKGGEEDGEDEEDAECDVAGRDRNGVHPVDGQGTPDILDFYGRTVHHEEPEVLTVSIVKGLMGFGFTIADSAHGQKVKKILDRPRCKNLSEGDVLLKINGKDVRGLEHAQVVQFLKDCAQGIDATITVQRGGHSSGKNRSKLLKSVSNLEDNLNSRKNDFGSKQPDNQRFNSILSKTFDSTVPPMGQYRSKTPTAELYSSHREKEVVPNRPKTPLVDTRNRPKTPTVVSANGMMRSKTPLASSGPPNESTDGRLSVLPYPHPNSEVEVLGPGSLYGVDANARDLATSESWPANNREFARGYGESSMPLSGQDGNGRLQPFEPPRGPHHMPEPSRSSTLAMGNPKYGSDWPHPSELRNPEDGNPYIYEQRRGESEGSGSVGVYQLRRPADHDLQFLPHQQPTGGEQTYATYGRTVYGRNSVVSNGGHSGSYPLSNGTIGLYDPEHGTTYPPAHLRKHGVGVSFEHEQQQQPSPVTAISNRNATSWYGSPAIQPQQLPPPNSQCLPSMFSSSGSVPEHVESTITLYKQEAGFGFRIVGGTEEGSQVSIGHIVPGGAADLDGNLRSGDEITSVDGQSVLNTSHHHVVQLMGHAAHSGKVVIGIRRRLQSRDLMRTKAGESIYPYDVTVVQRENEGFGFVIISSVTRAGSTIGRIIENSPAERCGRLHVGDRILAVNGKDIMNLHHGEIVNFIKDSGSSVTLTIGPPQDDTSSTTTSASQRNLNHATISAMAMPAVGDSEMLMRRNLYNSTPCLPIGYHDTYGARDGRRRLPSSYGSARGGGTGGGGGVGIRGRCGDGFSPYGTYAPTRASHRSTYYASHDTFRDNHLTWIQEEGALEDEQYYAVELFRGTRGFGFSIRGGREFQNMPLFVLRIAEDGPAARDGRLRMGDQIVEINGINTKDMTHADAIELIKQGGSSVRLLIKRGNNKVPPPHTQHPAVALDHRGGMVGQHQVVSPVLAGNLHPGGHVVYGPSAVSSHLMAPSIHNGPLGQSSPRVLLPAEKDVYYSQWEYERGPV